MDSLSVNIFSLTWRFDRRLFVILAMVVSIRVILQMKKSINQ